MHRILATFLITLVLSFLPNVAFASENSYITIVNPVRISAYTKDPVLNLQTEYAQVADRELPATWLLTYDVLISKKMVNTFLEFDQNQELGVFLEVSPHFSKASGVVYNQTNSWHRATSLFLSGYTQADRQKLIDIVFSKFKKTFGYYPKSVGAWWVDSYSLSYMKNKYGITGVLGVADQYNLDGYQVWGTPYSQVYYPSKNNPIIPAKDFSDKLDVVVFRWAARDPLNGYLSPSKSESSLYSIQDYPRNGLSIDYYKSLVDLYSTKTDLNDFAQITLGLEADYGPEVYKSQFAEWMDDVVAQKELGKKITTMSEFSKWYRGRYKNASPATVINSPDLLNTTKNVVWFNNRLYRIGVMYDNVQRIAKVIDLRMYPKNYLEPYYLSPNKEFSLSMNTPFVIDSVVDPKSAWNINAGELTSITKKKNGISLEFERGKLILADSMISTVNIRVPQQIRGSNQVSVSKKGNATLIYPEVNYPIGKDGILFSDFSLRIPFALKHRIERFQLIILVAILVSLFLIYFLLRNKINVKHILVAAALLLIGLIIYLLIQLNTKYYISQTEYDALSVLKRFPQGNVLVYDKDCLRCKFESKYKPASAAGIKNYVSKYSGQKQVLDYEFQTAASSGVAKKILAQKNITYVYLPRYEGYIESLPYSGEDLGLTRIYENANAQIWQIQ